MLYNIIKFFSIMESMSKIFDYEWYCQTYNIFNDSK